MFFAAPGSGVRALRRDSRATKTEPQTGAVEPSSKGNRGKAGASVDAKVAANKSDKLEVTKGRAREAEEIHMRRGMRMNLGHVGGERGRDNRTQGRGRKPRETLATRAGRPVEEPVSRRERKSGDENQKRMRQMKGRSIMSRKMTKEEREVPSRLPGEPGPSGPGDTRTLRS